jgi:hypothetical protein
MMGRRSRGSTRQRTALNLSSRPSTAPGLNLIEGFFSKLARSVPRHIRVASKQELKNRLMAAMDHFNQHPVVHTWTYKVDKQPDMIQLQKRPLLKSGCPVVSTRGFLGLRASRHRRDQYFRLPGKSQGSSKGWRQKLRPGPSASCNGE